VYSGQQACQTSLMECCHTSQLTYVTDMANEMLSHAAIATGVLFLVHVLA
jgi:hypothetical protein